MTQRSRGIAVAGAHRTIRALADGEGPFDGELVTRADGIAVRLDADQLRGWAGWAFAGAEHVAGPLDVALREDGQDVLLPWCVRTVRTHLAQSESAGGLAHGEAVTLAVSVLRGVLELESVARSAAGERGAGDHDGDPGDTHTELRGGWWLTDEARPVFAIGAQDLPHSDDSPCGSGAGVLRDLEERIEDRALRRVLTRLADALQDPRRLRAEAERWEAELLEIAAPRPLRIVADGVAALGEESDRNHAPRSEPHRGDRPLRRRELRGSGRAGAVRSRRSERRPARPASRGAGGGRSGEPRAGRGVLRGALARLQERAASRELFRSRTHAPVRLSAAGEDPSPGRKRWRGPVLVAVSAAALIAVAGALWPAGTGSADAADRATTAAATPAAGPHNRATPAPGPSHTGSASGGKTPGTSGGAGPIGASSQTAPAAAGAELMASAQRCQAEPTPACAEVWDGGAGGARPVRAGDEAPVLIEDYGDIAAIRNGSGDGAQMIVIIRRDAEWRIRDVYDIADPPSSGTGAP